MARGWGSHTAKAETSGSVVKNRCELEQGAGKAAERSGNTILSAGPPAKCERKLKRII